MLLLLLALAPPLHAQKAELDIAYAKDPKQTLDLYLPARRNFATVVYTYGGGCLRPRSPSPCGGRRGGVRVG